MIVNMSNIQIAECWQVFFSHVINTFITFQKNQLGDWVGVYVPTPYLVDCVVNIPPPSLIGVMVDVQMRLPNGVSQTLMRSGAYTPISITSLV